MLVGVSLIRNVCEIAGQEDFLRNFMTGAAAVFPFSFRLQPAVPSGRIS
jgi:hypothetical protein